MKSMGTKSSCIIGLVIKDHATLRYWRDVRRRKFPLQLLPFSRVINLFKTIISAVK